MRQEGKRFIHEVRKCTSVIWTNNADVNVFPVIEDEDLILGDASDEREFKLEPFSV